MPDLVKRETGERPVRTRRRKDGVPAVSQDSHWGNLRRLVGVLIAEPEDLPHSYIARPRVLGFMR